MSMKVSVSEGKIGLFDDVCQFFLQLRVLMWKNAILRCRNPITLITELAVPTVFMAAILGIYSTVSPTVYERYVPDGYTAATTLESMFYSPDCGSENLVWRCLSASQYSSNCTIAENFKSCQQKKIAIAPQDSSVSSYASSMAASLNSTYTFDESYPLFDYFESESIFLDYILSSDYSRDPSKDIYSAAIIVRSGYPSWDYTVRLNQTFSTSSDISYISPSTDFKNVDDSVKTSSDNPSQTGAPYAQEYLALGYFTLTDMVNSYIATTTCTKAGICSSGQTVKLQVPGIVDFPNKAGETVGFWSQLGFIFALFVVISLMYPVANVIKVLVQEKETKLREGMMMMSVRADALWISWIIHFYIFFLCLSIILTLVSQNLFKYSDSGLIFIYYFLFFLASTSYSIFISTLFSTSRAASIIGSLIFFLGVFIYIGIPSTSSRNSLLGASIHPATAFTFGTLAFQQFETNGIGVTQYTYQETGDYNISFGDTLGMLIADTFLFLVLAWYCANVWPSEYGTSRPWYFVFDPRYWLSCCFGERFGRAHQQLPQEDDKENGSSDDVPVEEVTENLRGQIARGHCVDIHDLRKGYSTNTGIKMAVDGLNLTMYSGQITALLGHNGAGKSTTIAMLTGLIPADSGKAFIEGADISENMTAIRRTLGVCPQHDILFPQLTVEDHLYMFARFKGTPGSKLKEEVEKMIQSVGLVEKRKTYSKLLSGGQKRKLSVGIAFIGNSRVVFLDEPTSGMDPYSRRFTWNVIRQHREGRVIVLTTHFMDEADLLGDRIAIMGDGKLRCCGSSLFLKQQFGVGYNMTIEKKNATNFDSIGLTSIINSYIPENKILTDVGTEMTFQLPFASSPQFQPLFERFDKSLDSLGLQSYGMSVTTLEEVFLKVAEGTTTNKTAADGRSRINSKNAWEEKPKDEKNPPVKAVNPAADFEKIPDGNRLGMFLKHMHALFAKRILYFRRDLKSWILQFALPVLFVIIGVVILEVANTTTADPKFKKLSVKMYNSDYSSNYLPTPFNNATYINQTIDDALQSYSIAGQLGLMNTFTSHNSLPILPTQCHNIECVSQYILDHSNDYGASFFGAYTQLNVSKSVAGSHHITEVSYAIHSNFTGVHASPLYSALMVDAVVRTFNPAASVTTNLHPLPQTAAESSTTSSFQLAILVDFVLIAIAFSPAAFATFIVREKEVKSKYQQMVSGVSIPAYWLSTWIWDNLNYQITMWMIIVILVATPDAGLLTDRAPLGCTIALFVLFGTAATSFTYLCSFLFKQAAGALVMMIFAFLLLGLALTIVGVFLRIFSTTSHVYIKYVHYLFALFPPFAFGDGLYNLAFINIWQLSELQGSQTYYVTDWQITGLDLTFLAWESVVYLLLTMLVEYSMNMPSIQALFVSSNIPTDKTERDEDVLEEERKVAAGETNNATVVVRDVKKVYPGGKYAVKGVSLAIPTGECFGLLGINGAGKSTTLSILTGEIPPTSGDATLGGLSLLNDIHMCRKNIGYCPQFDALFDLLTGREHLYLYARVKGIVERDVPKVVNAKIKEMGLTEYADRAAGTYSGGNKRKLSVAIAMIGEPTIVFLDEPSTGMDPMARRFMWEVISDIVTKREKCSLILTTHSMEECEALCTRIGIMVGGVLRCLGSGQRLRSRYGLGFQIEVGLVVPETDEVEAKMNTMVEVCDMDKVLNTEPSFNLPALQRLFSSMLREKWLDRITLEGTGSDLKASIDSTGSVGGKHLASWCILEDAYDELCKFLDDHFTGYVIRERQTSKVRVEVPSHLSDGSLRRLSTMFGLMEANKTALKVKEYSVSQTTLEQIFNQFASQQEEEQGHAHGLN